VQRIPRRLQEDHVTPGGWPAALRQPLHRLRRHGEPDDLPVIIEKSSGLGGGSAARGSAPGRSGAPDIATPLARGWGTSGANDAADAVDTVKIPPRCPRAHCFAERFVLTARTELTDRILIFGERHLRTALARYGAHYNGSRPHRALRLRPPRTDHRISTTSGSGADTCSAG
jgi:hypothetical protein